MTRHSVPNPKSRQSRLLARERRRNRHRLAGGLVTVLVACGAVWGLSQPAKDSGRIELIPVTRVERTP